MSKQEINDLDRRAKGLYRIGVIDSINYEEGTAVVDLGNGIKSPPLHWGATTLGDMTVWSPPKKGQQVEVHSLSGDLAEGRIGLSLQKNGHKFPSNDKNTVHFEFKDGAKFIYNHAKSELTIDIPKKAQVTCPEIIVKSKKINITAEKVKIKADIDIDGDVVVTKDVVASGISLVHHTHTQTAGNHFGAGATTTPPK